MNNKKITYLFILIATMTLLGIVGFTIAYFTSSVDFENEFTTGKYETTATETFTSPDNWMPGDTTPKALTIENTGDVDVKARVCITEEWVSSSGDPLSNTVNGERVAILNLANTSDWTNVGNCYIYNDVLEPDDVTNSFIESVTFNPNIEFDITCTTSTSGNSTTKTCGSSGEGYDNATYNLTFRVDTAQANSINSVWTDAVIGYSVGDTIVGGQFSNISSYSSPEELMQNNDNIPFYIRHIVENDAITESDLEFVITEDLANDNPGLTPGVYILKSGGATINAEESARLGMDVYNNDSIYYSSNVEVLNNAFGVSNCTDAISSYFCNTSGLHIQFQKNGEASADYNLGYICVANCNSASCGVTVPSF